ncbi:Rho GTPase-activating protein 20, partial [Temnothorax longispinosus]
MTTTRTLTARRSRSTPTRRRRIVQQLFAKGPFKQDIFRKFANVRIVRELRKQIESSTGDLSCLEDASIIAMAALLKDFLRSLLNPLLISH